MPGSVINNHVFERKFGVAWHINLFGESTGIGYKNMNSGIQFDICGSII